MSRSRSGRWIPLSGVPPEERAPGALVFRPTTGPVGLRDWRQWWTWVPGASWRHTFGPDSSIEDRLDHPLVQVAFPDAGRHSRRTARRPESAPTTSSAKVVSDTAEAPKSASSAGIVPVVKHRTFRYPGGLRDFVSHINRTKSPIHSSIVDFAGKGAGHGVEIAMQWNAGYSELVHTFANTINTHEGGTGMKRVSARR